MAGRPEEAEGEVEIVAEIEIPRRTVCCCAAQLWCWVIASICLTTSIMFLILTLTSPPNMNIHEDPYCNCPEESTSFAVRIVRMSMENCFTIFASVRLTVDLILIIGLLTSNTFFLLLWLIEFCLELVMLILSIIVMNRSTEMPSSLSALWIIFESIFAILLYLFFLRMVLLHRQDIVNKLKKERQNNNGCISNSVT